MQKIEHAGTSAESVRTVISTDTTEAIREMLYLDYQCDDSTVDDVLSVLTTKSERVRQLFLLRGYGFGVDKIGDALGISHQAVSKGLSGVKKILRERLQN